MVSGAQLPLVGSPPTASAKEYLLSQEFDDFVENLRSKWAIQVIRRSELAFPARSLTSWLSGSLNSDRSWKFDAYKGLGSC